MSACPHCLPSIAAEITPITIGPALLRLSLVDLHWPPVEIRAVERPLRGTRFGFRPHLHEPETLALAGIPVGYQFHSLDGTVLRKRRLERLLRD